MRNVSAVLMSLALAKRKLLEFVRFDSKAAAVSLFLLYFLCILFERVRFNNQRVLSFAGKMFRHVNLEWARRYAADILNRSVQKHGIEQVARDCSAMIKISETVTKKLIASILESAKPFNERLIILSPPNQNLKGVILVKFTSYFPYLPDVFDLKRLGQDYVLVLEPSSTGYFDEALLCLIDTAPLYIVEAHEPIDFDFVKNIGQNFIPINLGTNSWVDHRRFYPIEDTRKVYDIIMVSIWSDFKRHYHLFDGIAKSKKKDKVKVALVGKPWPWPSRYVVKIAEHYGVRNCLSIFEDITQDDINLLLNKSKVHILLSKKEGDNKATIEAMYANVPSFILDGFNYGHAYSYINPKTGGFIKGANLPQFIDAIDDMLANNNFSPRNWVSHNISPELSTKKLVETLIIAEKDRGIFINKDLKIKVNIPNCDYYDQDAWRELAVHYRDLHKYLKA